jgi:hypothetical protein
VMYHFYEFYGSFLSSFKRLIFGNNTSILSLEVKTFLHKRGNFESNEKYSIIRVYYSQEAPIYLPFYVPDKIFMVEVYRQYRFWPNFFCERKKNKFIPLSWKVGEITLKNASKIDEFATQFDQYNMKLENQVKGFDPQQYFMNHIVLYRFQRFIHKYLYIWRRGKR